ncbi:hypothetical protein GUITHDRAFT_109808 [Guillardia theta CCMP2712]|uniref:Uncharacterized protein n=1 Tax=Guillardia theta (strain CCMP2712) TaxID=905079 RepID=L1J8C9_GUITC|nr:hypothetical protein GUITHDRAFT_109808 [Guillardia theta CCMP2712]EKX44359.1 hypothetical protein GUITHDRAFT_109808 [Guillardia theta CCMP2712]|eukprot:XP_005831339.1 hypothetical protein GUITHDRAFT_109808 [Guillardia theta CCMP2712]
MATPRPRAHITDRIACEIYLFRLSQPPGQLWLPTPASVALGRRYGITPKAVRDIWNRRTWAHATRHLWEEEDRTAHGQMVGAEQMDESEENVEGQQELPEDDHSTPAYDDDKHSQPAQPAAGRAVTGDASVASMGTELKPVSSSTATHSAEGWLLCPERISLFTSVCGKDNDISTGRRTGKEA